MNKTRVEIVQENLHHYLATAQAAPHCLAKDAPLTATTTLTVQQALEIFADQVASRLLDIAAREMRKTNQSFYTISSAGHEQNTIVLY